MRTSITATAPNGDQLECFHNGHHEGDTNAYIASDETYYRNGEELTDDEANEELTIMDGDRARKIFLHEFIWEFGTYN